MPSKRKPPPLAFTALTCQFAPETRYLPAGKATRYMGGKAALTLSGGASEIVCLMRRRAWGVRWPKRAWDRHHFDKGIIRVSQTPADYESGATYELTARELGEGGRLAKAAVDFPPGAESLGWQGTESIRAFPLVRTESAILLLQSDSDRRTMMARAMSCGRGAWMAGTLPMRVLTFPFWPQPASAGGVQRPLSRVKTGRSSPDKASLYW